jgi:hypothetical protein
MTMSREIGIAHILYKPYLSSGIKEPRARFVQYYKDLYKHLGSELDEQVFQEGAQASYSALGELVLAECYEKKLLQRLDLLVAAYWAYEFDPDHASCGAYLCHRYQLDCKLFDVCEQGTLSPFTAIKLIKSFMQTNSLENAMMLLMEQTTIPRNKSDGDLVPTMSGATAVLFQEAEKAGNKIIDVDIVLAKQMTISGQYLVDFFIEKYIQKIQVGESINLYLRKQSYLWHLFHYYRHRLPSLVSIKHFSGQPGCLQPWELFHTTGISEHSVLIDQDVESLNTGILTIQHYSS